MKLAMQTHTQVLLHVATCAVVATTAPVRLDAQSVRDSAGVRVVVSAKPAWTAANQLRLAATPKVLIGDRTEDAYLLSGVRAATRLSDGRIVIANNGSGELRFYDAGGVHLKSVGKKGDGPGDFRSILGMTRLAGDTIAVLHENTVLSLFTSTGGFIKRTRAFGADIRATGVSTGAILTLNGGLRVLLAVPMMPPTGSVGAYSDVLALHTIVNVNDSVVREIGRLPFMEAITENTGPGKPWLGAEEVSFSTGAKFYLGYGKEYSIRRYSSRGDLELVMHRNWTPTAITANDKKLFADEWTVRWNRKPAAADSVRNDLLDDRYAKSLPAFSALIVDRTGKVWVRSPKAIDGAVAGSLNDYSIGPSTWSVFAVDGRWLGDVTMPARFSPTEITADYVLGIARDDDGVQTIVQYALGAR